MYARRLLASICAVSLLCSGTVFAENINNDAEFAPEGAVLTDISVEQIESSEKVIDESDIASDTDIGADEGALEIAALKFDGGNGTEEDPYLISTQAQLELVADVPNKCFKLTNDIELSGDWIPLGEYGDAFSGVFDGGGFTVSNMNITDGTGFFREVTGTVKDLNIEGSVTSTKQYTGGLAGKSSGNFENCSFSGSVTSNYTSENVDTGGLIGYQSGGSVKDCFTTGNVVYSNTNFYSNTGGLIGYVKSNADISGCWSLCDVSGYSSVGGLIGYAGGNSSNNPMKLNSCYAKGTVRGNEYVGGLIGEISNVYAEDCYAIGDAYGKDRVGGLIGYAYADMSQTVISTTYWYSTIKKSYATGNIYPTSSGGRAGGFIGYTCDVSYNSIISCYAEGSIKTTKTDTSTCYFDTGCGLTGGSATILNSYACGDVTASKSACGLCRGGKITNCYAANSLKANSKYGLANGGTVTNSYYNSQLSGCNDTNYGTPKTTSGMKNQLIYEDWDFDDVWTIDESGQTNDGYPYLQWAFKDSVRLSDITLDRESAEIRIGETLALSATAEGENTDSLVLTWESSNSEVAAVNRNGIVTAKKLGTAVITASYGTVSASCTVEVVDGSVRVTKIELDKTAATTYVGEATELTATITPSDATNKNITWRSDNTAIATVSGMGGSCMVSGVSEGKTKVYAVSESNNAVYAVCDITVAAKRIAVTGISFDNIKTVPYEIYRNKSAILTPTIKPSNATNKNVIWTSSDSAVVTVENGKITGISEGTATVTATTEDGGKKASVAVKVLKPEVYVEGIYLNLDRLTVNVKATAKLTATVTPEDADNKTVTFKSNNNAIATVSADGTVTGIAPGTTLIQAVSETKSGTFIAFCTVTVPKPVIAVTSVKLDKSSVEIVEGKTVPVKAVIKPSNATYKTITWSTSDESVATVTQDGYITAHGVGEAAISATSVNDVSVICNVTVLPSDTPAQLKVEDATVKAGKDVPITVSIASNPGISTFNFDLEYDKSIMYPVSYTKGEALDNVNIITPLDSMSFENRDSVRFLCSTADSKNMDTDGDLITVVFRTKTGAAYGDHTIKIVPAAFTDQFYKTINLKEDNCTLTITDYTIGDVNNDDAVDLKDSMVLGQYIAGFGISLSTQGKNAAAGIYPDSGTEPTINDFQHLFRYLSDWQVELGKE